MKPGAVLLFCFAAWSSPPVPPAVMSQFAPPPPHQVQQPPPHQVQQPPPHWRWVEGTRGSLHCTETTTSETTYDGQRITLRVVAGMEMQWRVTRDFPAADAAQESAGPHLRLTTTRLRWRIESPDQPAESFDTRDAHVAAANPPASIIGLAIDVTLAEDGRIAAVQPTAEAAAALKQTPRGERVKQMLSAENLETLLQSLLIPIPRQAAGEWTRQRRWISSAGPVQQTDTFRDRGWTRDRQWTQITWSSDVQWNAADTRLRAFQQHGSLWKSRAAPLELRARVEQEIRSVTQDKSEEPASEIQATTRREVDLHLRETPS